MPDDRGRTEGDHVAGLLQAPAKIDVVAGLVIFEIEAADVFEGPAIEGHVTAGNVLGDGVGEQHVARSARRGGDAGLDPVLRRRRNVRSADARVVAAEERADQIVEPVRDPPCSRSRCRRGLRPWPRRAPVLRAWLRPWFVLVDVADVRKAGRDLGRVIGRSVVDQDHFVVGIIDFA